MTNKAKEARVSVELTPEELKVVKEHRRALRGHTYNEALWKFYDKDPLLRKLRAKSKASYEKAMETYRKNSSLEMAREQALKAAFDRKWDKASD